MKQIDVFDVLATLGGFLLVIGIAMIYLPAAFITVGLLLIALGVVGSR